VRDQNEYKRVEVMRVLGHYINHNGSSEPTWSHAKRAIWNAWYGNLCKPGFRGNMFYAAKLLDRSAGGALRFHNLLLPWSASTAAKIRQFQTFLIARATDLPWLPNEDSKRYWQRRTLGANHILRKTGFWDEQWTKNLPRWLAHLGRHPDSWLVRLLRTRDGEWLKTQRAMFSIGGSHAWTLTAGRTNTRVCAGKVHQRQEEGYRNFCEVHDRTNLLQPIFR
jgi:hypothetical protein